MLLTLLAFAIVIGPLIFVHELGHFAAAKALGVQVIRFSLGIGPAIRSLTFHIGETEYGLSWLPIGGYVSMATLEDQGAAQRLEGGAPGSGVRIDPERVFEKRPIWARAVILLAGVTMNALFAFAIYATVAATTGVDRTPITRVDTVWASELPEGAKALGDLQRGERITTVAGVPVTSWEELQERLFTAASPIRVAVEGRPQPVDLVVPLEEASRTALIGALAPMVAPVVGEIRDGPASRSGFQSGDTVVAVNGETVMSWYQFTRIVRARANTPLTVTIHRAGTIQTIAVTPEQRDMQDPHTRKFAPGGYLGISPDVPVVHVQYGLWGAIREGGRRTLQVSGQVLAALKGLVTGQISVRELGGPIRIGQVSGEAFRLGLGPLIGLIAALSINLAVLNLLPIPVLDGGGLLLLLAEAIRRRPLSVELRTRITNVGLIVVTAIMLFAISNDVFGLFRR
jgi:regulator of sigma E protease